MLNSVVSSSAIIRTHLATKLNIVGMDKLALRRPACVASTASSTPVRSRSAGRQKHFGDRPVTEEDYQYGDYQYAQHKRFNEFQAADYNRKYGMTITGVRPANVTGPDKVRGSVDHVNCVTQPARGKPISFPFADAMRCPIHVDDIAEVFSRVLMTDKPKHSIYNSGGVAISLGDLAKIVRGYLPDAQITFEKETGGKESSGNYLIDNRRLVEEFGVQYRAYPERVLQIINEVRALEWTAKIKACNKSPEHDRVGLTLLCSATHPHRIVFYLPPRRPTGEIEAPTTGSTTGSAIGVPSDQAASVASVT